MLADDARDASVWSLESAGEDRTVVLSEGAGLSIEPQRPAGPDPFLEPGFPVQALHTAGSYQGGQGIHTLVGNIDTDPQLEILVTSLAGGPLNAWNSDGSVVSGWPAVGPGAAAYPALGNLSNAPGNEVFAAHYGTQTQDALRAWLGNGATMPGWPRDNANYTANPPSLGDVDGDGIDEIFLDEEDQRLHAYRANGSVVPGWPVFEPLFDQKRHTPAIVDIDGDGDLEILSVTGAPGTTAYLLAYHHSGEAVAGYPVVLPSSGVNSFLAVGDVDGDGDEEIVVFKYAGNPTGIGVVILSPNGTVERTITAAGAPPGYGTAPALADLDGDSFPEIILQADHAIYAWKGDGSLVPGWPQLGPPFRDDGHSAPVIGDLTGDCQPEIAVTMSSSTVTGDVLVYDRGGNLHPAFPKALPIGDGAVPAIADFDGDGRNELIVSGSAWNGVPGVFDKVWAYDLGGPTHGPILWGQFMADARHQGRYRGGNLTACAGFVPVSLTVDPSAGPNADGNLVLEPGETVVVSPGWRSIAPDPLALSARSYRFTGPIRAGTTYTRTDAVADYGIVAPGVSVDCATATANCFSVGVSPPIARRPLHWDARLEESLSTGATVEWKLHLGDSFADVGRGSPFYRFVETLLHHNVTTGCSTTDYCPQAATTRVQMAVFVLVSKEGSDYVPPPCTTAMFNDVPASSPFCPWVEELARRGVVSGCGGGDYCPSSPVTREQMAVFVLATKEPGATPQPCGSPSMFNDVPANSPYCRWIEELARRGIVAGCGGGNYCPKLPVSRDQMSVFLTQTFSLLLYGP